MEYGAAALQILMKTHLYGLGIRISTEVITGYLPTAGLSGLFFHDPYQCERGLEFHSPRKQARIKDNARLMLRIGLYILFLTNQSLLLCFFFFVLSSPYIHTTYISFHGDIPGSGCASSTVSETGDFH